MKAEEIGKQLVPAEPIKLPPIPVFDEAIDQYLAQVGEYKQCTNKIEFDRAKELGNKGTALKGQIAGGYAEIKRAIDAYKQPILDQEKSDTARVVNAIRALDDIALPWQREQDRLAQEAADRRRQEEIDRRKAEKDKEAEVLKEFGDEEGAAEVASTPIIEPRLTTTVSEFSYRRGAARKPKLKAKIVDPNAVKRDCCSPDMSKINSKIDGYTKYVKQPTEEQVKKWAAEIGGVSLNWE